jgi:predicted P-loop ATPase
MAVRTPASHPRSGLFFDLFSAGGVMVDDDKIVRLPVPASRPEAQDTDAWTAESHARADTERRQQLFDWADGLLAKLGLDKAIAAAKSIEALRGIVLDLTNAEIVLAIRDALHPAAGKPAAHFRGLKEGALKQILQNRFTDMKKTREAKLRNRRGGQPDWTDGLIRDKDGKVKPLLANLVLTLREAPAWKGVFGFDDFSTRVVVVKTSLPLKAAAGAVLTDLHESRVRIWFQDKGIYPTIGDVGRAIQTAAQDNTFNPLRDRLSALVWDKTSRADTWLQQVCHAEDSPYVCAIGSRWLIAAVARVFEPGCQADNMIVLEGPQGQLKSTLLRKLAINNAWFADRISNITTKDAMIETAGVWIIEIGELEGLKGAAPSAQKRFISARFDRYRPVHGKHPIRRQRQCIFAGSVNPPPDGRYLHDPTGARRFWPVICIGTIDIAGFLAMRDQLLAEAVFRYKAGEPWHLETPELEALAVVEQDKRFVTDPWEELIREWLGDRNDVSLTEVLQGLELPRREQTQSSINRVQKILTHRMGFRRYRSPRSDGRKQRYRRDPLAKKDTR